MQFGLIGEKLGHSFSKELHGKICDYQYDLVELAKKDLADFFAKKDFYGLNVTVPYKETVLQYLDEISPEAREIGAVNTILNQKGKLIGYNTDYLGFEALIKTFNFDLNGKKILVLGTGGTSKTVVAVLKKLGAVSITKVSRTGKENAINYDEAYQKFLNTDFIINTTPLGMFPDVESMPLDIKKFENLQGVIDVVYNPLRTSLQLDAENCKIKSCGGLYMLVAQGVYAASLFQNFETKIDKITQLYLQLFYEKQNIVLIGMPSCGKTTVGKKIAEKLHRKFFDTDEILEKKFGITIADFIMQFGEEKFREQEQEVIIEVSKNTGAVIATGGGAVLEKRNVRHLKHNGMLFFIDRDLALLKSTSDRPLSSNQDKLAKMFAVRRPLYEKNSDVGVDGNLSIEQTANLILEKWRQKNENFSFERA